MTFHRDCGYLKFNNRLCLHYYDGLPADINKALKFKLMTVFELYLFNFHVGLIFITLALTWSSVSTAGLVLKTARSSKATS